MSIFKYIAAATLALSILTLGMVTQAQANTTEQNQKLEQEFEVECSSGSYDQKTTCKVKGTQTGEQTQRTIRRITYHKPVDTALDFPTLVGLGSILTVGTVALVIKARGK